MGKASNAENHNSIYLSITYCFRRRSRHDICNSEQNKSLFSRGLYSRGRREKYVISGSDNYCCKCTQFRGKQKLHYNVKSIKKNKNKAYSKEKKNRLFSRERIRLTLEFSATPNETRWYVV